MMIWFIFSIQALFIYSFLMLGVKSVDDFGRIYTTNALVLFSAISMIVFTANLMGIDSNDADQELKKGIMVYTQ